MQTNIIDSFRWQLHGKIAEPGGSLDAGKRGGADATGSLAAAQVTLIVLRKKQTYS